MTKHILPPRTQADEMKRFPEQEITLIIGDMEMWRSQGRDMPASNQCRFINFSDLTDAYLRAFLPNVVLSPLFGKGFDALEVAQKLMKLGYQGPYLAVSNALPRPDYVRREIRTQARGIDFDLVIIPDLFNVA